MEKMNFFYSLEGVSFFGSLENCFSFEAVLSKKNSRIWNLENVGMIFLIVCDIEKITNQTSSLKEIIELGGGEVSACRRKMMVQVRRSKHNNEKLEYGIEVRVI